MNTLRKNPIFIAVILLVASAIAAHIYFNTDLLDRVQISETPQERTERILNEQRKQVVDDRGYFSLLIPQSWETSTTNPGGSVLSELVASTPDFIPGEQGSVTRGAVLEFFARASLENFSESNLLEKFNVPLGDDSAPLSIYRSLDGRGYTLIVQTTKESTSYEIVFHYDATSYPEGERIFLDLLRSVSLTPRG